MRVTQFFAAAALALASTFAVAAATDSNTAAEQAIRKSLQNLELEVPVESVASSPVSGLYEVKLQGGRVLYASGDGQFVMQGYLFQIQDGKPVNLTEKTERLGIAKLINGIPAAEMVVYPAKGETKSHITVFTDTTCPYCHKLHAEVPELNRRGIEVRYVAFPRQGLGSSGDQQLQAVWCSSDRRAALRVLQGVVDHAVGVRVRGRVAVAPRRVMRRVRHRQDDINGVDELLPSLTDSHVGGVGRRQAEHVSGDRHT